MATPEGPVGVSINQGMPDVTVIVKEGSEVGQDGVSYFGGQEVTVSGPTAVALVAGGYAVAKESP